MNKQRNHRIKLVTVSINGKLIKVDPSSIRKEDRQVLHGEYKGTQVNSPAIHLVGDSAIFWPDANKSFAVAMTKPELGVLSTRFLQAEGHTVKAS